MTDLPYCSFFIIVVVSWVKNCKPIWLVNVPASDDVLRSVSNDLAGVLLCLVMTVCSSSTCIIRITRAVVFFQKCPHCTVSSPDFACHVFLLENLTPTILTNKYVRGLACRCTTIDYLCDQ